MDFNFFVLTVLFTLVFIQILLGILFLRLYRSMESATPEGRRVAGIGKKKTSGEPTGGEGEGWRAPLEIDLIKGRRDIQESMQAFCEKYGIDSFTLASGDGLVIASSLPHPDEKAAHYSYLFSNGIEPKNPGVRLFGFDFNDDLVVGIVRAGGQIPPECIEAMKGEAVNVLTWWL
ncbi:MAG: hypothetical protein RQ758_06605 [Methanomicrobiaceae archaeon]|nr:hypothetical protein [Methanomicrobiaceae archaeon]